VSTTATRHSACNPLAGQPFGSIPCYLTGWRIPDCRLCFRDHTTVKYLNLSTKQLTTLYEGAPEGGFDYVVSGKAQQHGQPPTIYVAVGTRILLIHPGSAPQQLLIQWPFGFTPDSSDQFSLMGSDGDGGVVFTSGKHHGAGGRIFHAPLDSGHVRLLAGPPISSASNLPDSPDADTDWVPGCNWGAPEVPKLTSWAMDANVDIVYLPGSDNDMVPVVRATAGLKPPAHLQPLPLLPGTIPNTDAGTRAAASSAGQAEGDASTGESTTSHKAAVPSASIVIDASGHSAVAMLGSVQKPQGNTYDWWGQMVMAMWSAHVALTKGQAAASFMWCQTVGRCGCWQGHLLAASATCLHPQMLTVTGSLAVVGVHLKSQSLLHAH
jgi:hypothetical protein